jgi:hypothetical protein
MKKEIDFNDLTPLQRLRVLKDFDKSDIETSNLIKLVEKILHKELENMLIDIRKNIKTRIFEEENLPAQFIYKAEDIEKYFQEKMIEVNTYEN